MPIKSTIVDGIAYTEFSGEINYENVIKHTDFILTLKGKIVNLYELHDHTKTESVRLSSDEMRKVTVYSLKMKDIFKHSFIAVYAPSNLTFGVARMFETFFEFEKHPANAGLFKNKEDALQFLKDKMKLFGP